MSRDIRSFFKKKSSPDPDSQISSSSNPKPKKKVLKQATIESLGRVVVLKEIEKCKKILEDESSEVERIKEAIDSLGAKTPSREIIRKTRLGLILNDFRSHEDAEVAEKAKQVYKKWKSFLKERENKPLMRVKGDKATEKYRNSGIDIIFKIFNELTQDPESDEMLDVEELETLREFRRELADKIEAAVYRKNKSLVKKPYRRQMRKLAVKLKHEPEYALSILSEETNPEQVAQHCFDIENGAGKRQALIEI